MRKRYLFASGLALLAILLTLVEGRFPSILVDTDPPILRNSTRFDVHRPTGYATDMELPVACKLTEAEMRERRSGILDLPTGK
jgi:hypothetical protein